ncbi:MAG: CAP domain-containing protein [Thermoanaerobaculia bacterium]
MPKTTPRARSCPRVGAAVASFRDDVPARFLLPLLLIATAALTACGSGGNDSPTAPAAFNQAAVEDQSFQLVNQARLEEGLGTLSFDDELSRIAREHSNAMRDQRFFGHTDPEGNGLRSRLEAAGIAFSAAGENLAQVNHRSDPAGVAHQQLLASPEHRSVMLDGRFVRAGVGVASAGETVWITQVFLRP